MHLQDAIQLIDHPDFDKEKSGIWADLGSGTGLFSKALSNLLVPGSIIYAIDKSHQSIDFIEEEKVNKIIFLKEDFIKQELSLRNLDGILMANSLHFVKDKAPFIEKIGKYLSSSGSFIIVEYDTDHSNPWVPYPISFENLKKLFQDAGYSRVEKIGTHHSQFHQSELYGAWIGPKKS